MPPKKSPGGHSPAEKLTPKMQLQQVQRTNAILRQALESATGTIKALADDVAILKQALRAHILHVRELPNNPLFLQALVAQFDKLATEGEQMAQMKAEGKWVEAQLITHTTTDEIPAGRLVMRISVATRPNGDQVEYYPRVEQQNVDGRWIETPPFVLEHHKLSNEKLISFLPSMEEGAEIFLEIIPGYYKAEDADYILEELDYSLGGDDGEKYHIKVSTAPLSTEPDYLELSFRLVHVQETGYVQWIPFKDGDAVIKLPAEVTQHFAEKYTPALQQFGTLLVGFYQTEDDIADELLTGTPVEGVADAEPAEEQVAVNDAPVENAPATITGLLGSSRLDAHLDIGGEQVQLGTVVCKAFDLSGLTHDEWNNLESNDREARIQLTLDAMRLDAGEVPTTVEDAGTDLSV